MIDDKKILALCIPRVNDEDCHKLITALNRHLPGDSWRLFVFSTITDLFGNNPSERGETAIFDLINFDVVDALVVFEEKISNKAVVHTLFDRAAQKDIPIISIGEDYGKAISARFVYDEGFEMIVNHVLDVHKPKKPHFMAGLKDNEFSEVRKNVFIDALKKRGMEFDESMVSYGSFWTIPAREATEALINSGNIPDAMICANDSMAIAAAQVFTSRGYRVPEDVIVTGFDGIDEIKYSIPRISSCMCSYEEMAKEICAAIAEVISTGRRSGEISIMPTLILSESCGCNKQKPVNAADDLFDLNNRFYRFQEDNYRMYEMTARVLPCRDITEVTKILADRGYFYDLHCVLKAECLDVTVDPLKAGDTENAYGEEMVQFFNSDMPDLEPIHFSLKDILPEISVLMDYKYPLIFYGLHFLDIPLGYACFHFHNDDIVNYTKIPQAINALNNAIGSYRNMRYQEYQTWQIEEMYKLDNLTGLYNRNGFIREYKKITNLPADERRCLTVIMTDLDGLKYINDIFGHDEGDVAIKAAAQALKACCPKESICVRFGGDEMLAVYNGHIDEQKLKSDIEAYLNAYNESSGKPYKVSSSVGVQVLTDTDSIDLDELIKKSDKLMYIDKAMKKGLITSTDAQNT